ncbi:MAG: hypothetical protein OXF88_17815 [Rhodobacteraceae bacterium]|nr:hypothetical protein [Paracoccaceae bacterium]MCY4137958.1 hypothetical protein [Paracoccaceae bacterium]
MMKNPLILMALLLLFALSGCGGGGGSSGSGNTPTDSLDPRVRAATSTPIPGGSVIQASTGKEIPAGLPDFDVSTTQKGLTWEVLSDGSLRILDTVHKDSAHVYGYWMIVPAEFLVDCPSGETCEASRVPTWEFGTVEEQIRKFNEALASFNFGLFANGNDPFLQANIQALTGTATYSGNAYVAHLDFSDKTKIPVVGESSVLADASLTVDFGDGSDRGSISGYIDNIDFLNGVRINLNTAAIGPDDSGFYTGTTATTIDEVSYSGKWGGQFYGNSGTNQPGSTAGTFGGAVSNGDKAVYGAFSATRQ